MDIEHPAMHCTYTCTHPAAGNAVPSLHDTCSAATGMVMSSEQQGNPV